MTNNTQLINEARRLVAQAQRVRDLIWQDRDADAIPESEANIAMDSREVWQLATTLYANVINLPDTPA